MKRNLLTILFMLLCIIVFAQKQTLTGTITDQDKEPLTGATIIEKGTNNAVITDLDGKFSIIVESSSSILEVRFLGFTSQSVPISGKSNLNIILKHDLVTLNEVVAVGYGVQKKSDITGAVASVDYSKLQNQAVNTVDQAIQGRVAGVQVMANSGSPGAPINIRVRGIGTINDADPLYVVDGVPVDDISFLNSNDVKSIEILKDASSSAIYGSRGANGVILITTNTGKLNSKAVVSVNAYYGVQKIINNWETTSGAEWLSIEEELNKTRTSPLDLSRVDPSVSTNWFDVITQVAPMHDVTFGVSGGTDKMTYSLSIGNFGQDGTILGTSFKRNTIKLNSEYQVSKIFKIGSDINLQDNEQKVVNEGDYHVGIINTSIKIEPVVPVWEDESMHKYGSSFFTDYPNPLAAIEYTNTKYKRQMLVGSVFAELEILKDLKFKTMLGFNYLNKNTYDFIPTYFVNVNQQNVENKVTRILDQSTYMSWINTANYIRSIGKNNFQIMAGFTAEEGWYEWFSASKTNISNEDPSQWYLNAASSGDLANGNASEVALLSGLGRVNYNYDNKYLLTLNFRADGSSRFPSGSRWGYFPSIATGWKISEEEFMKDIKCISTMKLRFGWGQIGNNNINKYPYQRTVTGGSQYRYLFGTDETISQGYTVIGMKDRNIKWETVESSNFGIDASLFDRKLSASIDWYTKTTKNMLVVVPIPLYYGYESGPTSNVGSVRNRGIELTVDYKKQLNKKFSYHAGFNISTYNNKVISLGNGQPITSGTYYGGSATRTEPGQPIGYFYGYVTDGLFQSQDDIDNSPIQDGSGNSKLKLGDLKFKDINNDGIINDLDRTKIGSPIPDFTYGVNGGGKYKDFAFDFFFQGSQGNEIFNAMKTHLYNFDGTNKHIDMINSWTPSNTDTNMPRLNGNDQNNTNRTSDRFVEDGSYLRLKNVTLSYNLPKVLINRISLSSLQVYVSGQNLWTITSYSGADPEIGQVSSTQYLSRGVDIGTYPQAQIYTFGIKATF